ncbi:ATP-binding protein [Anabaena sp. PCC 7108]|uniref:ATP-binding protein n=1 Tax=Anabaena sp. PCC 7108 TaxID=163908 RepID=UPI00034719CD|nr:ATP-binding protein [Anabaena sp. PCC 7108]
MTQSGKVQASESGKAKLKAEYKRAGFTIASLAEAAKASEDQIKYLIGQNRPNITQVDRFVIENVVNAINAEFEKNDIDEKLHPSDIVDNWYPSLIPEDFKIVIADKTQIFCGRGFVFNAINQFIENHQSGYFTILGDAGMGKSAIAAKYIVDNPGTICFFNIRAEGRNRPDVFLKLIRQQLTQRFDIANVENDDLSTLLIKASQKLSASENLVIVIDALDEVDQDDHGNLLNLPMSLPDKVYIILTRRPYNLDDKRLSLSPNTKYTELDLRQYQENSKNDVESYILEFLSLEKYKAGLESWINQQNNLSKLQFVKTIAAKSENNFMYLRYVLEAIAEGFYQNEQLEELPAGLQGYYESHWRIMGMTKKPLPKDKIKIIYVMCALKSPVSREMIIKYSQEDDLTVQEVLKGWTQFLQEQKTYQPPRYRFYHESFRDFLQRNDIVEAAGVSLPEISAEVANKMDEGLML